MVLMWVGVASAQAPRSGREKPTIQQAIETLTEEARQSMRSQRLTRTEADFAAEFEGDIPTEALLDAVTRPAHADSFIDAYVRWQLTSFNPPLPALDERQLIRLMANAPAQVANPCADAQTVATFERAEEVVRLADRDRERLRTTWNELAVRRGVAESFNSPALLWRKWIDNQLPARGPYKVLWQIERVGSTVAAGWDSRSVKGDLTRLSRDVGRSVGDLALDSAQTSLVCQQVGRMKGLRRRMIEDVAFLANGRVDVSFFNLYVSDNDIEKWVEALGGTIQP